MPRQLMQNHTAFRVRSLNTDEKETAGIPFKYVYVIEYLCGWKEFVTSDKPSLKVLKREVLGDPRR